MVYRKAIAFFGRAEMENMRSTNLVAVLEFSFWLGRKNGSEITIIRPFAIFGSMRTVVRSRRREKISFDYLFSRSLPPHVYGIESIYLQFWVGLFVATTPLVAYVMMSAWWCQHDLMQMVRRQIISAYQGEDVDV